MQKNTPWQQENLQKESGKAFEKKRDSLPGVFCEVEYG